MLNKTADQKTSPKLSEVLFERSEKSFSSLAVLPSNADAVQAGHFFAAGMNAFVAITGPSGWGKSHLLDAAAKNLTLATGIAHERLCATDLLANPSKADQSTGLILDDVQEVLGKARSQIALRLNLERRVRSGKPTLLAFTLPRPTRQLKAFLPSGRDWVITTMKEPQPQERIPLLKHLSVAEGLTIGDPLTKVLAYQMYGNGRTLAGALKRLRLAGLVWEDTSATLRACGILEPFFADNADWDLKLRILKVAEQQRAHFPNLQVNDLAIYTMLKVASLSESGVARTMSLSPADVYLRSRRFAKQAEENPAFAALVRQFVSNVVETLQ